MVTSSAVVGSSAISSLGLQISAMAIIARWRMPPENSCGYWSTRFAALLIPTISSISTARFFASSLPMPFSWLVNASISWLPTV